MANNELLSSKIQESGLKKEFIAKKMGMCLTTLNNKISGRTAVLVTEAFVLKDLLRLEEEEFKEIFLP